jgi:hypothetical protein
MVYIKISIASSIVRGPRSQRSELDQRRGASFQDVDPAEGERNEPWDETDEGGHGRNMRYRWLSVAYFVVMNIYL